MLWQHIESAAHIAHVVGEETHHQILNLLLVFVILGVYVHVDGDKLRNTAHLSLLFQGFDVAVNHGKELQWIQFLALELDFHVEHVGCDGYHLSCLDSLSVVGEDIAQMGIRNFVLAITDNLIDAVDGIIA